MILFVTNIIGKNLLIDIFFVSITFKSIYHFIDGCHLLKVGHW